MNLLSINKMPMRWTDLDAYAHMNHAAFFDFMTEARFMFFKDCVEINEAHQFVTVRVECDYKVPYHYPDIIILKQYCEAIGNSSFTLRYEFYSERKPDLLYAHACVKMVAFDPIAKKPVKLPHEIVSLLEKKIS